MLAGLFYIKFLFIVLIFYHNYINFKIFFKKIIIIRNREIKQKSLKILEQKAWKKALKLLEGFILSL